MADSNGYEWLQTPPTPPRPVLASSDLPTSLPSSDPGELAVNEQAAASSTPTTSNSVSKPLVDAQGRPLNPRSCVTCRKRKVRCDKTHPCNHCSRAHVECVFPAPGRAPRKVRKVGEGRDKELLERLRRLESVVTGLGVEVPGKDDSKSDGKAMQPDRPGNADSGRVERAEVNGIVSCDPRRVSQHAATAPTRMLEEQMTAGLDARFGRLVINEGRSRYINSSFWASLSNEVEDLKAILNQSSDEEYAESPPSDLSSGSSHQGFLFGYNSQNVDLLSLHPLSNKVGMYWEIFKDRVDPLVKVLHIPTIEPTVLDAASHLSNLSKGFEALLFAMYYGAATSLSPQDCAHRLGEEKAVLLSRYRFGIEQALARANFLTTEELVVLQAFIIYLMCLRRNSEARIIWTLTGLVVRIAQTMGIHRDGSNFGLPPFDVEMRRRLWWQVCILDIRASEDHGCDPTIVEHTFDTKMPLNVNDSDISSDMSEFPSERLGGTDMSFCLVRAEVADTFRRINYNPPSRAPGCDALYYSITLQDKERWITDCHQRLEEQYLKHCDMSVPLYWVTATVTRLIMSKMWLMVYHPFQRHDGGASLPEETREKLFITSLENVEYALLLETESRTMKWGWLFKTYVQWHALAFMLGELCHRTTGELVERAWRAIEQTRDGRWTTQTVDDARPAGHLWRPLKKLYRRAKEARQRGLQEEQLGAQRLVGASERRYSPNANPMFGHPNRPQMVRAPLSAAQLQRFSQGPTFGQMPLDKHELLKSPNMSENGDSMDASHMSPHAFPGQPMTAASFRAQPPMTQEYGPAGLSALPTTQALAAPIAEAARAPMGPGPPFGKNFLSSMDIDFGPIDASAAHPATGESKRIDATSTVPADQARLSSSEPGFDLEAASVMDTAGDLNWENWDQLVRQFGMETNHGSSGSLPTEWAGRSWDTEERGGPYGWRGGMAGMGMGMGMGIGDGF